LEEIAVIEQAVRAEEKQNWLFAYDQSDKIITKFHLSDVRHWWMGDGQEEGF